jgi:hypothetical protein
MILLLLFNLAHKINEILKQYLRHKNSSLHYDLHNNFREKNCHVQEDYCDKENFNFNDYFKILLIINATLQFQ